MQEDTLDMSCRGQEMQSRLLDRSYISKASTNLRVAVAQKPPKSVRYETNPHAPQLKSALKNGRSRLDGKKNSIASDGLRSDR